MGVAVVEGLMGDEAERVGGGVREVSRTMIPCRGCRFDQPVLGFCEGASV